jgi:transcriptional regulator with XRE-family HTH domain
LQFAELQDILIFASLFEGARMKRPMAKTLGQRVKERRLALGLSQPQLAKRVGGITYQAIQQLEQGGGTKHLVGIARVLGTTAEWLQDGHGPMPFKSIPNQALEPIKVLGMAECGPDGWSLWNGDVIDVVDRPSCRWRL